MDKRIFIAGPSGMGKTTLAKYISDTYDIQYVNTSASKVWDKYGFKTHAEAAKISTIDPAKGSNYQFDVLNERLKALLFETEFVCDRSYIDNFVHYMVTISAFTSSLETEVFIKKCEELQALATHLIFIPYTEDIRLDGDKRIKNYYYHQMISQYYAWVIWHTKLGRVDKKLVINHWDFEIRKRTIEEWLEL